MNEVIKVTVNDNHEPIVSGRQLHEALGVKTEYRKWFWRKSGFRKGDPKMSDPWRSARYGWPHHQTRHG